MPRRPSPESQAGRILEVLEVHNWVSTHELIYGYGIPSVVHSRINDLRAKGWAIEHRTVGPGATGSQYRLASVGVDHNPGHADRQERSPQSNPDPEPGGSSPVTSPAPLFTEHMYARGET